ncbi:MAG: hypothetical protein ACLUI3_01680 [Christensenellales bacterium]
MKSPFLCFWRPSWSSRWQRLPARTPTVTAWISDGAETVIYTSMFDDFNSKHDDIQVDYQFFAQDELLNKLQTARSSAIPPTSS